MIEEEAAWFWALWLENDENQLRFHLDLEILAQIFHAYHCHHDNGYAGFHRLSVAKLSGLRYPAASSSESTSFRFLQISASSNKKIFYILDKHISVLFCT